MKADDLKLVVKEKYGSIAGQSNLLEQQQGCCGSSGCCGELEFSMIGDEYTSVPGYNPDADLGLGCGLPTEFAGIKPGDSVLDLGSGAGNDCFVTRSLVGETGKVTGLDFTEEMVQKARKNLAKTGFKNIEFIQGDIEKMPLPDSTFDVILSNCVLNLVPDKQKAFSEIYRVLKPGGHFCISDVVTSGELPEGLKEAAEMYAGCVSGATEKQKYLKIIEKQGFSQVEIQKEKPIVIPDSILDKYLGEKDAEQFKHSGTGVFSITVTANK
ncbi:Ubiquinone/menaquinone biosynthesis C-methylase UbiE [Tangfeifania diversioriginum]|uniref:Arsenite methyltransferase n=1 Tax=Tangfeifania diversioriginum TaxID=1168035 RepID=A0A1M6C8J1_9BACT|nr:arsenite methyltransferase [Tangfeifania diversioriginum]SHI57233.1 Ubiquinone/menaquinone biosynthesis C-methylase UbiE [Tangfeifania diversioriginum]